MNIKSFFAVLVLAIFILTMMPLTEAACSGDPPRGTLYNGTFTLDGSDINAGMDVYIKDSYGNVVSTTEQTTSGEYQTQLNFHSQCEDHDNDTYVVDNETIYFYLERQEVEEDTSTGYYGFGPPVTLQKNLAYADNQSPSTVTSISANEVSVTNQSTINISWNASTDNVWDNVTYLVYRAQSSGVSVSDTLAGAIPNNGASGILSLSEILASRGITYYYTVYANDTSGNLGSKGTADSVTLTNLVPVQVTGLSAVSSNRTVNLSWSAVTTHNNGTSIGGDLAGYHVYWNNSGTWTLVSTTTNIFYYNDSLINNQAYMYKVAAFDQDGNEGQNSTTVSATPSGRPLITPATLNGSTVKPTDLLNFTLYSGAGLDTVYYNIYNSSGSALADSQLNASVGVNTWTYSIDPSTWVEADNHKVQIFANDTNGQSYEQNFTYRTDDTNPVVSGSSVSDADDLVQSTTSFMLNVTATDNTALTSVTAGSNNVAMSNDGSNYYLTTNASALGCSADAVCAITFTATDLAGNTNSTHSYSVTVDDTAPTINSVTLSDDYVQNNTAVVVTVNVSDANTVSAVTAEGTSLSDQGSGIWNGTITLLDTATDEVDVVATDAAGNQGTDSSTTYTVDDVAPVIYSATLSDDYVQNNTEVNLSINVSDQDLANQSVWRYYVGGNGGSSGPIGLDSGVYNTTLNLTDDLLNITISFTDEAGNTATIGLFNNTNFTVDDTAPIIHDAWFSDDYVQNNTEVTLFLNVSDQDLASREVTKYMISGDGTSVGPMGFDSGVFNTTLNLSDTLLNVTVSFTDEAGNSNSIAMIKDSNYTIDDIAPVINSVSLADSYVKPGQVVQVTVNVTDAYTSIVTADGVSLTNTSADIWVGNLTFSSSGVVTVTATDAADNNATNSSTAYTVDSTPPSFSIVVPIEGASYTNADGNITFNFTVSDASLAAVNISLDGTPRYGNATNGTHTTTFTNLKAGTHTAVFTALDNADNAATVQTINFKVVRPLNATEAVQTLNSSLGTKSLQLKVNGTDQSSNETLDVNQTLELEMELNVSNTNVTVNIPEFDGLEANWERTFTSDTNSSSTRGQKASSRAGSTIQKMVLFQNAENFLSASKFTKGGRITFQSAVSGLDILYIADDEGESVYKLSECSSAPTSAVTTSNMCYTNTSSTVTVYVPHFSGAALANDTTAPDINITAPTNSSTENNSKFAVSFDVYESNPASNFCNVTLTTGSNTTHAYYDVKTSDMTQSGTKYTYTNNFTQVYDNNYNLSVKCIDQKNQTTTDTYALTVADAVAPLITASGPSGEQSTSSTSISVTLSATTDEPSKCRYDSQNVNYSSMDNALGSNASYATTHETDVSYTSDDSGETFYARCIDINGQESTAATISFTVNVGSSSSSPSGGTTSTTTTTTTYTKTWGELSAGETATLAIDQSTYDGVPFTGLEFKTLNDLEDPQIKVRALTSAPSSTGAITYTAYKYIQLVETNMGDEDLESTKVSFSVPKSWLSDNGVSKDNIALFRYQDDIWTEQDTQLTSEDSEKAYYVSNTEGFSYFAIGQRAEEQEPEPQPEPEPETTEEDTTPTGDVVAEPETTDGNKTTTTTTPEERGINWGWMWGIIVFIVVVILAYLFWREGKLQKIFHLENLKKHGVHKPHENLEKLESFIDSHLKKGHHKEDIIKALKKVGWAEDKIEEAFQKFKK